jgi:hypothetical protein
MATYIVTRVQEESRRVVGTFGSIDAAKDAIETDKEKHISEAIDFGFNAYTGRVLNGEITDFETVITASDRTYLTAYQWEVTAVG